MHNPAARRTPARRTITPASRPTIARRSALCIAVPILIKLSLGTSVDQRVQFRFCSANSGARNFVKLAVQIASHPTHATQSPANCKGGWNHKLPRPNHLWTCKLGDYGPLRHFCVRYNIETRRELQRCPTRADNSRANDCYVSNLLFLCHSILLRLFQLSIKLFE